MTGPKSCSCYMRHAGLKSRPLLFQSLGSSYSVDSCNKEQRDLGGQKISPAWESRREMFPKGNNADSES